MKKKVILFVSALLCVFSLAACGNTDQSQDYNGMTAGDIQAACEQTANTLNALSDEECEEYYQYYLSQEDGKIYADLMQDWMEVRPEAGEFQSFSDFEITKAGKTLSAVLTMKYSQRDVTLTYVMNAHDMEVTAVNTELVYTLGEKMSKAGLNTVMGISIVFIVLMIISLCIYAFKVIPVIQEKFTKDDAKEEKKPKKVVVAATSDMRAAPQAQDDLELIAVITAAIAASTGTSTDDFVVRSIKRRF